LKDIFRSSNLSENTLELIKEARAVTDSVYGQGIYIRGIIEYSNICRKNCTYCGIRGGKSSVTRYRLTEDEIVSVAENHIKNGIKTVVLQGGEDSGITTDLLCRIIERIKGFDPGSAITLSIGEKSYKEYCDLKSSGADRFLIRFETSNEKLYRDLHPGDTLKGRLQDIDNIRKAGFELGSGFMAGLPGEEEGDTEKNLELLKYLGVHMIGVGPFIPSPGTPLENFPSPSVDTLLSIYARMRIMFPDVNIAATTAMDALATGTRALSIEAGANVLMPNLTPLDARANYNLYTRKGKVDENLSSFTSVADELESFGYKALFNERGDSKKFIREYEKC
jgi:biotin synthase